MPRHGSCYKESTGFFRSLRGGSVVSDVFDDGENPVVQGELAVGGHRERDDSMSGSFGERCGEARFELGLPMWGNVYLYDLLTGNQPPWFPDSTARAGRGVAADDGTGGSCGEGSRRFIVLRPHVAL